MEMVLRPLESSFLTGSTCSLQNSPKVHVSLVMTHKHKMYCC